MTVDCLKCINSACCKLDVEVDVDEYEKFKELGLKDYFETRTDIFLKKEPKYKEQEKVFNEMYKDNFAILKKGKDGQCLLLDRTTMMCTIYEDRPKVCKEYTSNRCEKIRELTE
jgi:Fe-S-cluster containining protein